jgi:hypothetical protein
VAPGFWPASADRAQAPGLRADRGVVQNPGRRMHTRGGRPVVTAMHGVRIGIGIGIGIGGGRHSLV